MNQLLEKIMKFRDKYTSTSFMNKRILNDLDFLTKNPLNLKTILQISLPNNLIFEIHLGIL